MNKTTHFDFNFAYLLLGIAIGTAAGVLLAPRSGEEIRNDVRRRAREGLDYLSEQAERLRDRSEKVVNRGKEWIGEQKGSIQSAMETKKPFHEPI
jgi:gas vesicle protein